MGAFDNYKKNAYIELEKELSNLERQNGSPDKDEMSRFSAKVQFAQRINLINLEKAREYRKRVDILEYNIRTQTGIIDDGYENPLEKDIRYSNMEAVKEEIAHERIANAESLHDETIKTNDNTRTVGNTETARTH